MKMEFIFGIASILTPLSIIMSFISFLLIQRLITNKIHIFIIFTIFSATTSFFLHIIINNGVVLQPNEFYAFLLNLKILNSISLLLISIWLIRLPIKIFNIIEINNILRFIFVLILSFSFAVTSFHSSKSIIGSTLVGSLEDKSLLTMFTIGFFVGIAILLNISGLFYTKMIDKKWPLIVSRIVGPILILTQIVGLLSL